MKIISTIALLFIGTMLVGQFTTPFEFYDQDHRSSNVTAMKSTDLGIIYTAYSFVYDDGGTRVNQILPDGSFKSVTVSDVTHDRAEIIETQDGSIYAIFYEGFDCDYVPFTALVYNFTEERVVFSTGQFGYEEIDITITNMNGEHIFHLLSYEEFNDEYHLITVPEYYNNEPFNVISDITIEGNPYGLFMLNNQVLYFEGNGLFESDSGELVVEFNSPCIKVEETDSQFIFFSDKIDYYNKVDLMKDSTLQINVSQLFNPSVEIDLGTFTAYANGVLFINPIMDPQSIFFADEENNINTEYTESYPGLLPDIISSEVGGLISFYQLHNQQSVVRKTEDLVSYDYDRVNIHLSDPYFYTFSVDTFQANVQGDTTFYTQKYVDSEVSVRNFGEELIENLSLLSHKIQGVGWDCGFSYIKSSINTNLLQGEEIRFSERFKLNIDELLTGYFYAGGANYKLDKDPTDNYVSADITSSLLALEIMDVSIFPNPFIDHLQIETNSSDLIDLEIYDATGARLVKLTDLLPTGNKLDLDFLQPGVYFIKLIGKDLSNSFRVVKI